ncbi:hypothetical protein ACHAWF_007114 [Thalassiosira exigua]
MHHPRATPRARVGQSSSHLRRKPVRDARTVSLVGCIVLLALWPYTIILHVADDPRFGNWFKALSKEPAINYLADKEAREVQDAEADVVRSHAGLVARLLEQVDGQHRGDAPKLRSCRYDRVSGRYQADPFGGCVAGSGGTNVTAVLLRNPFRMERTVCGRPVPAGSGVVLSVRDVGRLAAEDDRGGGGGRWSCLRRPSQLYKSIPTMNNAMNFPPVKLGAKRDPEGSLSKYNPTNRPCDVPCLEDRAMDHAPLFLHVNVNGDSWPFTFGVESAVYYSSLKVEPHAYRDDRFYATTDFRSDVVLTYADDDVFQNTFLKPIEPVNFDEGIKGASFMARNCKSRSGREAIVKKLQASPHIRVDSLSSCLHNAKPPPGANLKDKIDVMKRYLFHLAFENSIYVDYITEKLWLTFQSGTIPVYLGSPNVKEHVPPNSIVHVADFPNTEDLAEHLANVARNRTLYESYHEWRRKPLPEHLLRKYGNHTRWYSGCRLCRWGHARSYGLTFNHVSQGLREPRIPRRACVTDLNAGRGMIASPFVEDWRQDGRQMADRFLARQRVAFNGTSSCGIVADGSRSVLLQGTNGEMLRRDVWEHDGVMDLHVRAASRIDANSTFELVVKAGALTAGKVTFWREGKGMIRAYVQDGTSRFVMLATPGVDIERAGVHGNAISIFVPAAVLPVAIRVLTEDLDTFHLDAQREISHFAKKMTDDFEAPLEAFYMPLDEPPLPDIVPDARLTPTVR